MLRFFLLVILLTGILSTVCAQKLKKRTETVGIFKEVYHIDKKSKFRNGESFIIYTNNGDTLATGSYLNSSKTGIWTYRDVKSNEKYIIYDYSNDRLIYLNQSLVADSFLVKTDEGYVPEKVDRPLVYLGLKDGIAYSIGKDLELPGEVMKNGQAGLCILQYFVDENGNLTGPELVSEFNREMEQYINKKVFQLSGEFLPAIVDGRVVASSFFIRVNVGLDAGLFAQTETPPYVIHIDSYYTIQTRVTRGPVRYGYMTVKHSEIR